MIKVYTTQTCAQCPLVKRFLDLKKLSYTVVDLTNDMKQAEDLQKRSGYIGTPITEANGKFVKGFNAHAIMEIINA